MSKKTVKVGVVQMHCTKSREDNLEKAVLRTQKLAKRGAQIVCLPELFASEYFCQINDKKFFNFAEPVPGPITEILGDVAKKNRVAIITSVYEKARGANVKDKNLPAGFFNTSIVIDADGSLSGKYRKMHIPADLEHYYGEDLYFQKGDMGFLAFKTKFAKVAAPICWDQWYPEAARVSVVRGAQILFYPTAIAYQLSDKLGLNKTELDAWQIIQRSHAIANGVFVVAANRVGPDFKLNFWGSSFIADPYGRILAQASDDKEEEIIADCDLSLIDQMRSEWPFLACRRVKCEDCVE